ncbi:MAG: hypothetical protein R6V61_08545 [Wenzhouxiangellaceae bacterium]
MAGFVQMQPLRLVNHMPSLVFTGSEFPQRILDAIVISIGISVAFAVAMYLRDRRGGLPFLLAAVIMAVQAVAMYVSPGIEWIRTGFAAYASIPDWLTLVTGFALGAAVSWAGWRSVPGRGSPASAAPVAA